VTNADEHGRLLFGLRHPRTTVRWRLTLLYGGLFLACGAALLAVTYTLVTNDTVTRVPNGFLETPPGPSASFPLARGSFQVTSSPTGVPPGIKRALRSSAGRAVIRFVGSQQRISDLHQLEIESAIALAIMAIIATLLGWVVAGRVLRPLRTITATTRQISEANLHRRLALPGPRDELRTLADTIDDLLERLQGAFDAQRRFVANASHELRTPLTAIRALLEMVISDPEATVATFRETCEQVLAESEQQEHLIDALLALAQGQQGVGNRQLINLDTLAIDEVQREEGAAIACGLTMDLSAQPALISGDRRLIARLVFNLVQNAIRHNRPGGHIGIAVAARAGQATFKVTNTGLLVPPEEINRLLQPFQRLAPDRINHEDGLGLGLSIVAAIASAHDAAVEIKAPTGGGLDVEVRFPRPPGIDTSDDPERRLAGPTNGRTPVEPVRRPACD
jgi:signal transduction histidine kinase